jgi:hypothetical protein
MATKSTPGPWFVSHPVNLEHPWIEASCNYERRPDGTEYYMSVSGICNAADARLIAAAPELLEALRGMLICMDEPADTDSPLQMAKELDRIERARAVLSKATGEEA